MRNIGLLIALVITSAVIAQKKVEVKLSLRDGNTIIGSTALNDVVLKTEYGQLIIPIQKISSVQTGIGNDKTTNDKTLSYLKILNSNVSPELKKNAFDDLVKLDIKAISAIYDYLSNPKTTLLEEETNSEYTIDNALIELRNKYDVTDDAKTEDVILIDGEYTMGGMWNFEKLDVKTEYGSLTIPKAKIKNIEISYSDVGAGNDITLKLSASKYISGNKVGGWLKTGIVLKAGQKFSITATGEITLASLSNQKYKPDGSYMTNEGTSYPGYNDEGGQNANYPTYGNVVFKISENGEIQRAGSKYNGTAKANGTLMLSIYETVYNAANTGSYTVKISLK